MIQALPEHQIGCCVLKEDGRPFSGTVEYLRVRLDQQRIRFHTGALRGARPVLAR